MVKTSLFLKSADREWHLNTGLKKYGIQTPFRFQTDGEFLVKKVISWEGVWSEVTVTL